MKREKISIKWEIFLYLLGFTAILLVILWFLQIVYLDTFYKYIKKNDAESVQKAVVSLVKSDSADETISGKIDELAAVNNMAVYVTDNEGTPVYNAEYIPNSRMSSLPLKLFQQYYDAAKENGGATTIEYEGAVNTTFDDRFQEDGNGGLDENGGDKAENAENRTQGMETPGTLPDDVFIQNHGQNLMESIILVNIVTVNDAEYVVMVNAQLTPIDATVSTLKVQMIWISVIMILLSLVIAHLISRKISAPIIQVNDSAKELAGGNYEIEFGANSFREIAELSDTLNYTSKELGRTENLRRELIANVSHDLRTPLTMITAYSEVMRDLPGENTPENVQVVIDEAKRLTNLVNDMLDISKLQAGVLQLNTSVYNLTESIRSVLERYNKLVEQDGYSIRFEYDRDVYVDADEFKIYQVIYNLINNAVNYTGEDKKVTVKQIPDENRVRIEIIDDGEGIRKEDLPYVWDRYYKVDKTHKRAVMGTGLGLSIVKNILNMHGTAYGVESETGAGSTFWFELKTADSHQTIKTAEI